MSDATLLIIGMVGMLFGFIAGVCSVLLVLFLFAGREDTAFVGLPRPKFDPVAFMDPAKPGIYGSTQEEMREAEAEMTTFGMPLSDYEE